MEEFILRPYQKENVEFGVTKKRMINADEPGLGKTLVTLDILNKLDPFETLIISPKIALGVWQMEIKKWFGWDSMLYSGDYSKDERVGLRDDFKHVDSRILIANPAMLEEISGWKPSWRNLVVDEAHLVGLLNEKSKAFKILSKMEFQHKFLLTGTPIRRNPADLYPMLHLLNPNKFKSYWQFRKKYCIEIDTGFGKELAGRPAKPLEFKAMLNCYMVRHLKKDVVKDLPEKQRMPVPVEMNQEQRIAYHQILSDMILDTGDDLIITPGVLTQNLRMRQLLICPKILGLKTNGAALEALVDYLIPEEFNAGRSVVVTTPFRSAVPFVVEAIKEKLPGTYIEMIHGGQKELASTIAERFQQKAGVRKVLIYTIKAGASFTAHSASTAFFLGCEWSNNDNLQAEDRIHRIGQKLGVQIKYLVYPGTIDDSVISILDDKTAAANWILKPEEVLKKLKEQRDKNRGRC